MQDGMNGRVYEYVMDEAEIRECSLSILWEYAKCHKGTWLRLLLILAAELVFIPKIMMLTTLLIIVMLMIVGINSYSLTAKRLRGEISAVWIEGDRLKARRQDYGEILCRDIQMIRRTKRLLMLGYMQGNKSQAWFVIPLRAFADEQEVEWFLAMLHDPQKPAQSQWQTQNQWQNGPQKTEIDQYSQYEAQTNFADPSERMTDGETAEEYLRLTCQMNGEKWVRLHKGAADLENGGSLGKPARFRGLIFWLCIIPVILLATTYLTAKRMDLPIVCFDLAIAVWTSFWLFYRDPEKKIRKQIKTQQALLSVCGLWQFSLTEEGVCVSMPADRKNVYMWKSFMWILETEDAFYFFSEDKKRYFAIPKESFVSREQVNLFHRICADHGIQKVVPKKARYVPGWLMLVILALIVLSFIGSIAVKISLDTRSEPGYISDAYQRTSSALKSSRSRRKS